MRRLFIALFVLSVATAAYGQTVSGARFLLTTGPCYLRSGAGSPESAVTGSVCDTWIRTDSTGGIWYKASGSATTTGWAQVVPVPGLTSLTTLGTITTGVWNAGAVTSSGTLTENADVALLYLNS